MTDGLPLADPFDEHPGEASGRCGEMVGHGKRSAAMAATAEPALKPNQPTQSIEAPNEGERVRRP